MKIKSRYSRYIESLDVNTRTQIYRFTRFGREKITCFGNDGDRCVGGFGAGRWYSCDGSRCADRTGGGIRATTLAVDRLLKQIYEPLKKAHVSLRVHCNVS